MITRQRLASYGIPTVAAATIVTAALLTQGGGSTETTTSNPYKVDVVTSAGTSQIDVVFAVDTTGSMGGLLDGAKRTVWSIATHIRKTDPNANLRIGLVAYRDVGDDYVTRDFALTDDLDAVFTELSSYQAGGRRRHAGERRRGARRHAPQDEVARRARRSWCSSSATRRRRAAATCRRSTCSRRKRPRRADHDQHDPLRQDQRHGAARGSRSRRSNGEFSTIQQDGGVQQIATPYDDKMAELAARDRLDHGHRTATTTRASATRRKMAAAEAAPAAAKADRGAYYATKAGEGGAAARTRTSSVASRPAR